MGSAISRGLLALAGLLTVGASPVARLEIDVVKVRSDRGLIRLCLTAAPDNFPACVDDSQAVTRSQGADSREFVFEGLPPGHYAVAVVHDENANKRLDTVMGIPREGFGFSRNPPIGFGPPRFSAARFALDGHGDGQQIRMRYLL